MTNKLIATTALAALAFPGAALADKPADKPAKPTKTQKAKGVGFSVGGVDLTGLTVTDGKLAGALTLDPTSVNSHARKFLELSKADVKGDKTVSLGTAGDAVVVKYVGLTATDAVKPTDRVKVKGKLTGTTLDIRKVTVSRGDTEDTTTTAASKSSKKSETSKTAPGYVCRKESRKKPQGGKGKSAFALCVEKARKAKQQDSQ